MTEQEARIYLSRYKNLRKECQRLKLKIDNLVRLADGQAGMNFEKVEGHASMRKQLKDYINEINDLQVKYNELLLESERTCLEIEKRIQRVANENALYANILCFYYEYNYSLLDISVELNYSYRNAKYLLSKSIKLFCNHNKDLDDVKCVN